MPTGGIAPTRSFLMTFSHVPAFAANCCTSMLSSARFAKLALRRSLWQLVQYVSRNWRGDAAAALADNAAAPDRAADAPAAFRVPTPLERPATAAAVASKNHCLINVSSSPDLPP